MAGPLRAAGSALRRGDERQPVPGDAIGEPASADDRSTSKWRNGEGRVIPVCAVRWAIGCPC